MTSEILSTSYQFQHRQTWFGVVLMYRESVGNGYGTWEWGDWRKAKWSDMYLLKVRG